MTPTNLPDDLGAITRLVRVRDLKPGDEWTFAEPTLSQPIVRITDIEMVRYADYTGQTNITVSWIGVTEDGTQVTGSLPGHRVVAVLCGPTDDGAAGGER